MSDDDEPRQVIMHPALVPAFDAWLASRGLECRCIGVVGESDLKSWIVTPTDEALGVTPRRAPGE